MKNAERFLKKPYSNSDQISSWQGEKKEPDEAPSIKTESKSPDDMTEEEKKAAEKRIKEAQK